MEPLLTVEDARVALGGVSVQTLYRAIRDGELACVKVGARTLFEPCELEEFIRRNTRRIDGPVR